MPLDPVNVFSADIDPALAKANAALLQPHATLAFKSPSPAPAWTDAAFRGRLAYIVCTEDRAIPKVGQETMMLLTKQQWIVKELQGSHISAFLLKEQESTKMIESFVESFLQAGGGCSSADVKLG